MAHTLTLSYATEKRIDTRCDSTYLQPKSKEVETEEGALGLPGQPVTSRFIR